MHPACQKWTSDLRHWDIEYNFPVEWERWHVPTYPSAPNLHDNFPRVEVITLEDLLYTGGRTVEPEIMLGVSEDANVGFELRRSGRHCCRTGGTGVVLNTTGLYSHLPPEHGFGHGIKR